MTVQEAVERSKTRLVFGNGAPIKAAQKLLAPSEDVIWAIMTVIPTDPPREKLDATKMPSLTNGLPGILVVTDRRIFFVHSMMGSRTVREIPISTVRSVDSNANALYGREYLRITGIHETFVVCDKEAVITNLRNAISEARERRNAPRAAAPADDDLSSSDVAQLQALKELYDTGVLTAEEFAAKKAQILGL